ncbi:hypothetical protein [Streptomyces sp. AC555_RSS877]|uniref:hypothetical protein n=1 Tax=Streptomyces sp. AC555_RSS877 TaxID=2823688 RepID=UPI001C280ADC|nr:hypothetical protein [Streptomyces sp. AC555_RSS877]
MTDRHTVDSITSDALDALYESLEAAQDTELYRQLRGADAAFASASIRAARAEAAIARVRALCSPEQNTDALGYLRRSQDVLAALDQPAPGLAATQATDGPAWMLAGTRDLSIPAHDGGPTVREAADADARWPLEKHGE